MSVSQSQQTTQCCQNKKAYTITYSQKDTDDTITSVCITCFNLELKSKNYPDTLIKPYQRNTIKIICNSCSNDVTTSVGCDVCDPKGGLSLGFESVGFKTIQNNSFDGEHCCDTTNPDYYITYKINDTIRTNVICKNCITSQVVFDDKYGKLFILQINIKKIICIHCGNEVTKSKGCTKCKTVFVEGKNNET